MSCNDDNAIASSLRRAPSTRIQRVKSDYTLQKGDDQVHVIGTDDATTPITLTFPCNPDLGEQHLLVAKSAPITVDGGGAEVSAGATEIPVGYSMLYTFSKDPCDCDDEGLWVPLLIPTVSPG